MKRVDIVYIEVGIYIDNIDHTLKSTRESTLLYAVFVKNNYPSPYLLDIVLYCSGRIIFSKRSRARSSERAEVRNTYSTVRLKNKYPSPYLLDIVLYCSGRIIFSKRSRARSSERAEVRNTCSTVSEANPHGKSKVVLMARLLYKQSI
jgi:hypothetical protein